MRLDANGMVKRDNFKMIDYTHGMTEISKVPKDAKKPFFARGDAIGDVKVMDGGGERFIVEVLADSIASELVWETAAVLIKHGAEVGEGDMELGDEIFWFHEFVGLIFFLIDFGGDTFNIVGLVFPRQTKRDYIWTGLGIFLDAECGKLSDKIVVEPKRNNASG